MSGSAIKGIVILPGSAIKGIVMLSGFAIKGIVILSGFAIKGIVKMSRSARSECQAERQTSLYSLTDSKKFIRKSYSSSWVIQPYIH